MRQASRATTALAVILLFAGSQPAVAAGVFHTMNRASWAYVDLQTPAASYVDSAMDAPVGPWHDNQGNVHVAKSYFTFDLSALVGVSVKSATLVAQETYAKSCRTPRAVELWRTAPFTAPTWANQPAEVVKVADADPDACLSDVHWEATSALQDAVGAGQSRVSFALRVPDDLMFRTTYGRRYSNAMRLTVRYNTVPGVPAELTMSPGGACGAYVSRVPEVAALLADGDADNVSMQVAVWSADNPGDRMELEPTVFAASGFVASFNLPSDAVADGASYAWAARAGDNEDWSAWSSPCLFHTDFTPPATAPDVSSMDYPERVRSGGVGVTGTFVVSAKGDPDVVGFRWSDGFGGGGEFDADTPGGSGSFQWSPTASGFRQLTVYGLDRAGNLSPARVYTAWVALA